MDDTYIHTYTATYCVRFTRADLTWSKERPANWFLSVLSGRRRMRHGNLVTRGGDEIKKQESVRFPHAEKLHFFSFPRKIERKWQSSFSIPTIYKLKFLVLLEYFFSKNIYFSFIPEFGTIFPALSYDDLSERIEGRTIERTTRL